MPNVAGFFLLCRPACTRLQEWFDSDILSIIDGYLVNRHDRLAEGVLMGRSNPQEFKLNPSLETSLAASLQIGGEFAVKGELAKIRYDVSGDWQRLRPFERAPQPAFTPMLWQHTCFELFMARPGAKEYLEFNFAPSGHYSYCFFDDYRQKASYQPTVNLTPVVGVEALSPPASQFSLTACFSWSATTAMLGCSADEHFLINIVAVTEERDGALNYWALHHPALRADFHLRDGFVLTW